MNLDVYNAIKEIIGTLPPQLEWVYGMSTVLFLFMLFFIVSYPFIMIFNLGKK